MADSDPMIGERLSSRPGVPIRPCGCPRTCWHDADAGVTSPRPADDGGWGTRGTHACLINSIVVDFSAVASDAPRRRPDRDAA